jgi:chromosome segregation ATPase
VTVSYSTLVEWTESLQRADAYLTQAASRLADSQASLTALSATLGQAGRRLSQLDAKLTLWQEHSAELEISLRDSAAILAQLRETLRGLRERYDLLSQAFSTYRQESERQILARERTIRVWRAVGIGGVIAAVLAGIIAAVR